MRKEFIKNLLSQYKESSDVFKRNVVKEYLQILALSFIYSKKEYKNLVFYGGSCLAHCFNLPRLSEDLDFLDLNKKINLEKLANDLSLFFEKEIGIKPNVKIQKFRIHLKLPILYELKLADSGQSNLLILKIEIFKEFNFCKEYKVEIVPIFKFNKAILIRTFDLSTLMATKVRAVLSRKWEKTDKTGKILIKVKGRDYFDLMWYLKKGILPNLRCIEKVKGKKELKSNLLNIVENLDLRSIQLDLEPLIEAEDFVGDLSKNLKRILIREIEEKL